MIERFSHWLTDTSLSALFADTNQFSTWLIIPVSQSVHILAVSLVMISAMMLNLRLAGVSVTRQSFAELSAQLTPWIMGGLLVLLITGTVQTIAEPTRELMNVTFRLKMAFLLAAVALTLVARAYVRNDPTYWERSPERRRVAKTMASVSLGLWFSIAAAGRLIAYIGGMQQS